jgi:curli biogenesis system outer membrane secretion channel CsgG
MQLKALQEIASLFLTTKLYKTGQFPVRRKTELRKVYEYDQRWNGKDLFGHEVRV